MIRTTLEINTSSSSLARPGKCHRNPAATFWVICVTHHKRTNAETNTTKNI